MYTTILGRVIGTYTIILRRVNRMKIFVFVFVYIRRLGSLVAQGIGELTVPVWAPETGTVLGDTVPVF